jgi:hypothetical protein
MTHADLLFTDGPLWGFKTPILALTCSFPCMIRWLSGKLSRHGVVAVVRCATRWA